MDYAADTIHLEDQLHIREDDLEMCRQVNWNETTLQMCFWSPWGNPDVPCSTTFCMLCGFELVLPSPWNKQHEAYFTITVAMPAIPAANPRVQKTT